MELLLNLSLSKGFLRQLNILLLLIISCIANLNGEVTLPGVDVLSSGYDAASWTGKSRIFNLNDDGMKVTVRSIGKSYISPAYVNVITDGAQSKRVEESCVGVYSHFSDYVRTHQSSTSFDVGIKIGNFGLGISGHKDVKEVYDAITKKGQAIGLSESWWGVYEASLPPVFLMSSKMTPLFNMTVARLKKIGIPKTEQDQMIYNQVCCSGGGFGTHFVNSIIVGGRAKVTQFVNSSYHKSHSEKTEESQISIGFEYMKFNLSLSHKSKDFEHQLSEDFANNSNRIISYQPDAKDIHSANAPWLAWEKAVTENPVVVNKTVSSIANLFFDTPQVMSHMQKTIDFYIRWNRQPRLSELRVLRMFGNAKNSVDSVKFKKVVPGLDIVGCGFEATTLKSKNCFFEPPTPNLPQSKWSNPYYPDIVYDVPYGFFATNTPDSLTLNSTIMINSIDDYVKKTIYYEHHHSSGFLGFGSKDETTTTRKYYRLLYAQNYKLVLSLRQIAWFTLRLMEFPLPLYSKAFKMALNYLPSKYDPNNSTTVALYKMFFQSFGTDVVTEAAMGGMVWAENYFESCLSKMYSETCITNQVTRGWWFVHTHKHSHECDKRMTDDFKKYSTYHYEMLGGTSGKVKQKDWNKWVKSVKYDPRPVKYTLAPIHYLLYDSHPKKKALKDATYAYLKNSQDNREKIIESLKAVRPPPASVCKKIERQTYLANNVVNLLADLFSPISQSLDG